MYDGPMETVEHIRVNIWCMLDGTVGFRHKTTEMHFLSIQLKQKRGGYGVGNKMWEVLYLLFMILHYFCRFFQNPNSCL